LVSEHAPAEHNSSALSCRTPKAQGASQGLCKRLPPAVEPTFIAGVTSIAGSSWRTKMNPVSSGSILMNEDALGRLEAGLRAQREKLRSASLHPSQSLSPADNDRPVPMAEPQYFQALSQHGPIDVPNFLGKKASV
jgi:hypothetical protein